MKYALLVIDMQNGFLNPESPLCIRGARATVPACARLIAGCRSADIPVVFVNRSYRADGSDVENTRYAVWAQGGKPLTPAAPAPSPWKIPRNLTARRRITRSSSPGTPPFSTRNWIFCCGGWG